MKIFLIYVVIIFFLNSTFTITNFLNFYYLIFIEFFYERFITTKIKKINNFFLKNYNSSIKSKMDRIMKREIKHKYIEEDSSFDENYFDEDNNFPSNNNYGNNQVPYNQRWGTPVDGSLANEDEWKLAWARKVNSKVNIFSISTVILFLSAILLTLSITIYFKDIKNSEENILSIFLYVTWSLFVALYLLSIVFQIILLKKIWKLKSVIKGYETIKILLFIGIIFQVTGTIATYKLNRQIIVMREKYGITEEFNRIC